MFFLKLDVAQSKEQQDLLEVADWLLQEHVKITASTRIWKRFILAELDVVNKWELIVLETTKWYTTSQVVMRAGFSLVLTNGPTCKMKWKLIPFSYRCIANYHNIIGTNEEAYWLQSLAEHLELGLPKTYSKRIYDEIHDWFIRKPNINPPHTRNLMNPYNRNFHGNGDDDDVPPM
jgi:hypothetical protein